MYVFEDRDGQVHGAAPGRDRARRARLRPAPPGAAVEGLVRRALVPPREPPARALPPAPPARRGGARTRRRRTSTSRSSSLAHDFFAGLGLRDVELKLHSMGDRVCRPGYVELLGAYLAERADQLCPAHRDPSPGEPAAGARLQVRGVPRRDRGRPAPARPPLRRLPGPLRPGAGRPRRPRRGVRDRPSPRAGLRLLHPHDVRVRLGRARRGPERDRAAAVATTGWSRCWEAPRRRASGSASGWSACCSPATPRASSRRRRRRGAARTPT